MKTYKYIYYEYCFPLGYNFFFIRSELKIKFEIWNGTNVYNFPWNFTSECSIITDDICIICEYEQAALYKYSHYIHT